MPYKNKIDALKWQKKYRNRPDVKIKNRLRIKSFDTHIVRMYSGMKGRVNGKVAKSAYLYRGLYLLPKEEFYIFAKNSKQYAKLWKKWKQSNFNRLLTPSPNRKDNTKGYEIHNIEFVTAQENCKLAHVGRTHYKGRFSK